MDNLVLQTIVSSIFYLSILSFRFIYKYLCSSGITIPAPKRTGWPEIEVVFRQFLTQETVYCTLPLTSSVQQPFSGHHPVLLPSQDLN